MISRFAPIAFEPESSGSPSMHSVKNNAGLSMVELLVTLAISSFLLIGVSTIFLDNKKSYVFQQNQSENIETSRYTLMLLQDQLLKAGYRRRPDIPLDQAFPASNALGCNFSAGHTVKPFPSSTNAVCMRYQPRNHLDRDCLGNLPLKAAKLEEGPYTESGEVIVQRLYLSADALQCEVVHLIDTSTTPSSGELVTGLAGLAFEYGEASSASAQKLSEYKQAPTGPVIAVRYSSLYRSTSTRQRESLDAEEALNQWMKISGLNNSSSSITALKTADNGQLYQVAQNTMMLRNLMP